VEGIASERWFFLRGRPFYDPRKRRKRSFLESCSPGPHKNHRRGMEEKLRGFPPLKKPPPSLSRGSAKWIACHASIGTACTPGTRGRRQKDASIPWRKTHLSSGRGTEGKGGKTSHGERISFPSTLETATKKFLLDQGQAPEAATYLGSIGDARRGRRPQHLRFPGNLRIVKR